jgi:hypothetical protein
MPAALAACTGERWPHSPERPRCGRERLTQGGFSVLIRIRGAGQLPDYGPLVQNAFDKRRRMAASLKTTGVFGSYPAPRAWIEAEYSLTESALSPFQAEPAHLPGNAESARMVSVRRPGLIGSPSSCT